MNLMAVFKLYNVLIVVKINVNKKKIDKDRLIVIINTYMAYLFTFNIKYLSNLKSAECPMNIQWIVYFWACGK